MIRIRQLIDWFAGGPDGYMTLVHCMNGDWLWIGITVSLDLAVALGYVLIALHWRRNARTLQDSPAKHALGNMKNIFIFCGLCGYLFIPIKMIWPAWRLYDAFLLVLVYLTWSYALGSRQLAVVYNEIGRSTQLAMELEESRREGIRKSHFLNALSHDLKTPLNGLMLQAQLAEACLNLNDEALMQEALIQIKSCARTTADLLTSFLELGRLDWSEESILVEEFSLARMLEDLAANFRVRAELKGLRLDIDVPKGLVVSTDRIKLERLVSNLIDNAIKFTKSGGIRVVGESASRGFTIDVIDTGEGIAPGDQARVFDDFTQINNRERDSRKGFGLGLAIARRIAPMLGGHLTLESELGRGSRFTIRLPESLVSSRIGSQRDH